MELQRLEVKHAKTRSSLLINLYNAGGTSVPTPPQGCSSVRVCFSRAAQIYQHSCIAFTLLACDGG
jgi:hypothetical protein